MQKAKQSARRTLSHPNLIPETNLSPDRYKRNFSMASATPAAITSACVFGGCQVSSRLSHMTLSHTQLCGGFEKEMHCPYFNLTGRRALSQ